MLSRLRNSSFNFRVVLCRIRPFPTLISKIKWHGSELPLKWNISPMEMIQMYILDSIWKLWSRSDSKSCPNNWIWFWTWNSPSSNNRFEIPKWATQSVNQKKSKFFTWYRHPISRAFKPKTKKLYNCLWLPDLLSRHS